jgi:antitoxin (DNA-binding transcriptional repressor) of toxin-antitoxin stability system
MKAVGIKALKNNLSRYLDEVRKGMVILITDRDEVIAEIHQPLLEESALVSPWERFLTLQTRSNGMIPAQQRKSLAVSLSENEEPWPNDIDLETIYEETRADRT